MLRWVGVLSLALVPSVGSADVLTYAIWPDSNPAHSMACRIELWHGQIIAVEVLGTGMPPRHALRWPAGIAERAAIRAVLGAMLTGDLPSVEAYSSRAPKTPYVTVNWSTTLNGSPVSGLYVQAGLAMPPTLRTLLQKTMPGSNCDTAVRPD